MTGPSGNAIDLSKLETCDISLPELPIEPFVLVIFGAAGDLSRRMLLPALFHLHQDRELPTGSYIIGAGLPAMSDQQFRGFVADALRDAAVNAFDQESWDSLSDRIFYVAGDLTAKPTYRTLLELMRGLAARCDNNVIYYLALPPALMKPVVGQLKEHQMCRGFFKTKVIVEKPFGRDRASAVDLNRAMAQAFEERQIYRIDHYLGKETVQNIIFFRFANAIFEQLWHSSHIDSVQISVMEGIGIEGRGEFYEQTGVLRDMLQNHLLQLLGLVAMEPPVNFEPDSVRDEKVKLLRSVQTMDAAYVDRFTVAGQYGGGPDGSPAYRRESGVAPDSAIPTFVAAKMLIPNWRWAGVPFYLRTGKRLAERKTQICIQFKQPPLKLFGSNTALKPNVLSLTIQPQETILLRFGVKYPYTANQIYPTDLSFNYAEAFKMKPHPPYERLLVDCMKGDLTLFVRQDGVEAAWEIVDAIVNRWEQQPEAFPNYAAGSWGPTAADQLLAREGRRWFTV